MMNTFLTIGIVFVNIISIVIVYQFLKRLEKKEIVLYIAVCVAIMYILISITYWLSGFGVEKEIHQASKTFVQFLFVPVNIILFIPYIASKYMKLKENEIKRSDFIKKIEILSILLLVVLGIEFFYFRNIQTNIKQTYNIRQNVTTKEITNTIITNDIQKQTSTVVTNEI